MEHLDTATLSAYIDAELPADEMAAVAAHLEGCAACRREARELFGVATLVRELPVYRPKRTIVVDPAERDRSVVPMLLDFVKPVALAAVVILVALAGLRLAVDNGAPGDDPADSERSDGIAQDAGTDRLAETSEGVTAPQAEAPAAMPAPQQAVEQAPPPAATRPGLDPGQSALAIAAAVVVAGAAGWRVYQLGPVKPPRV